MIPSLAALRCGALSQVAADSSKVVRTTKDGRRRQGSTSSLNKRTRKPRTESAFRSITVPGDRDPLSLVGSEFLVGGRPEHRVPAPTDGGFPIHSPRYVPRGYPLAALERRTSGGGGDARGGRIRGGSDGGIGNSASTASSSSSPSSSSSSPGDDDARRVQNQGNNNDNDKTHSLQQMKLRQEILQSIHGRGRVYPTCPNCHGELTYLYISSSSTLRWKQPRDDNQSSPPRVSAFEIHDGDKSERYKMRHLLPPLCVGCRTHFLFEGSEMKFLMMENFDKWVDKCRRGSDTEDDEGHRHRHRGKAGGRAGAYDFNDPRTPRNARIVIVGHTPTPLPLHNNAGSLPRLGYSSRGERELNDERGMMPEEDTSTMSTYRRKGQLNYEHNREAVHDDDVKHEQHTKRNVPDENRQDEAVQSVNNKTTRKCDGKIFSFDDDLFLSDDSGDGRESIKLIRTASEEQMILENYSMKKEIASKQIAKDLLRGHELSKSKCERCRMPMTQNRDNEGSIVCVTCLGVKRKAKRIAKQKRKQTEIEKGDDSDTTRLNVDVFIPVCESPAMAHQPGKDSESLILLDETRRVNMREEGLVLVQSSSRNSPVYLETINNGSYGCGNKSSESSIGLNALHDKPGSEDSSIAQQSDSTSASKLSYANSFQSNSSSQYRNAAIEYSLSSYKEKTCQRHQSPLPRSFSNLFEGLASEATVRNVSSDVSSTRCPRNLPPSEKLYQGSSSEVSELHQSSIASHAPAPNDVPPWEMIQQSQQIATAASDGHVSYIDSNPDRQHIPEIKHGGESSLDKSSMRPPRAAPSNGIIQRPGVKAESAERPHKIRINTYQHSMSELSECQSSPVAAKRWHLCNAPSNEMIITPFQNQQNAAGVSGGMSCQNLDNQDQTICNASSGESSTLCLRDLPSNQIIINPYQNQQSAVDVSDGPPCQNLNNQDQKMCIASSEESSTLCPRDFPSNEMIITPCQNQQTAADVSEGLSCQNLDNQDKNICNSSSEVSSTLCPRDLPPDEMIWHYGTRDEHIRRSRGSDEDSISERIIQLAYSLREVADQLPLKDNHTATANSDLVDNRQPSDSTGLDRRSGSDEGSMKGRINQLADSLAEVADQLPHKDSLSFNGNSELVDNRQPTDSNSLNRRSGSDKESMNERIIRLGDSLREVADLLPYEDKIIANSNSELVDNRQPIDSNSLDQRIHQRQPFYPIQHFSNQINFDEVQMKHDSGTIEVSSKQEFHVSNTSCHQKNSLIPRVNVYPIPSPTMKETNSTTKITHSSSLGVLHAQTSPSVAVSNSIQHPINIWSKQHYMPTQIRISPIAAVRESKHFRNFYNDSLKNEAPAQREISSWDHSSPSEYRADPPGCRMEYCEKVGRDPPDDASSHSLINTWTSSFRRQPRGSHNSAIDIATAEDERTTPRRKNNQSNRGKDPPPEKFIHDRIHSRRSICKGNTPETKGRNTYTDNNRSPAQTATIRRGDRHRSLDSFAKETQNKSHPYPKLLEGNSSSLDILSWDSSEIDAHRIHSRRSIRKCIKPETKGSNTYTDINRPPVQAATTINTSLLSIGKRHHSSHSFDNVRRQAKPHPYPKLSEGQNSSVETPSWDSNEIDAPLQTAKSWGELDVLFKQIDEIEDDFNSIVATLSGSDGQSLLGLKSSNDSLNSTMVKHSLVEFTIKNNGSFESNASADSSMVTDAVEQIRRIKDYIEKNDSVDVGSDSDSYNSQGEMSELIKRLANAAESLRELNEWDD